MLKKRSPITNAVRFRVLAESGFRCAYCGASSKEARLEIDHLIPFSRGGSDDVCNLVAACFRCNRGKRDKVISFVPPQSRLRVPAKAKKAERECQDIVAAWRCAFELWWPEVDANPALVVSQFAGEFFPLIPTFVCRGRTDDDIGPEFRVLVTHWREVDEVPEEEQKKIRNAVISGYDVPTMILMGPPDFFFGVLVNERYKGCPHGRIIDGLLQPHGYWEADGWYPDENLDFQDLRMPFRSQPKQLDLMSWDVASERFVGVYSEIFREEG
jgi:hypothetical protein